jgi:hypothetical protein
VRPLSSCKRRIRLMTWAWIETSRADTGSSATMAGAQFFGGQLGVSRVLQ